MAQEDKRSDRLDDDQSADEATQLKKRARRRLIGAAVLALLAAIVLPMVMDHQPAPPLKEIQVRIPSPDEGVSQRVSPKPVPIRKEEKSQEAEVRPLPSAEQSRPEQKQEPKTELKPEPKPETPKPETKPEPKLVDIAPGKTAAEAWEVQLGAYQEPGRVKLLTGKLKELGLPSYTEHVETSAGPRTRVRAGPFLSQEAAEKARTRIKIIGVDGPVARKP